MEVFLNGQFLPEADAKVPLNDRGWLLGDGLFETVRVASGRPFRLAQHLERLSRSADCLRIRLPYSSREMQDIAAQLIERNALPESVLRLTLTRGVGQRGYAIAGAGQPTLAMTLQPFPEINPNEPTMWSLVTSSLRIPTGDTLATFKTTSKILNVMARAEAVERGADEALLLNSNGEVAEAASGNVFWIYQDTVFTVPTGRGVLPGITRAVVLEICQTLGLPAEKRIIKPDQLRRAEGIFITQSVMGIVPVAAFDGEPVAPSPWTERIASAYADLLQDKS